MATNEEMCVSGLNFITQRLINAQSLKHLTMMSGAPTATLNPPHCLHSPSPPLTHSHLSPTLFLMLLICLDAVHQWVCNRRITGRREMTGPGGTSTDGDGKESISI